MELVVEKRIEERSLCLSSSGKCHGDIGTPVRVSFEFLAVFLFVRGGGGNCDCSKIEVEEEWRKYIWRRVSWIYVYL